MTMSEPIPMFPDMPTLRWWRARSGTLVAYRCGRGRRCRRLLIEVFETPGGAVAVAHRGAPDRSVAMPEVIRDQRAEHVADGAPGSVKKYADGRAMLHGDAAHPGYVTAIEADDLWQNVAQPSCGRHGLFAAVSRADLMASVRRARDRGLTEDVTLS